MLIFKKTLKFKLSQLFFYLLSFAVLNTFQVINLLIFGLNVKIVHRKPLHFLAPCYFSPFCGV